LKRPNDVQLKGGKVPGKLLESASEAAPNRCKVVIGTGFNLAAFPADLEQPATSLAAHGGVTTPAAAFETLAAITDAWLTRWGEGVSFQTVRRAWLDRAGPTGRTLRVRHHGDEIEGSYAGLDSGGALRLLMSDGAERRIAPAMYFRQFVNNPSPDVSQRSDRQLSSCSSLGAWARSA
jgi:BirA family biotin operon repressor/biotin-[acetyl-CoA-carboxylase] ligase